MRPPPASARRSMPTPTSSSAPPSTRRSTASSASRWSPPASSRPRLPRPTRRRRQRRYPPSPTAGLPMPAQNEIRQARGESDEEQHPQKVRLSLLQRLANVGLGRRDEETEPPIAARASGPALAPLPERKPQRSVAEQMSGHEPVSE